MRFQDKVVNVTVAVSGIGKEVVRKLANAQVESCISWKEDTIKAVQA